MEFRIDITRALNEQFDALLKAATLTGPDRASGSTKNNPIRGPFPENSAPAAADSAWWHDVLNGFGNPPDSHQSGT